VTLIKFKDGNSSMHIHILGICGTFMGGAATLATQLGHKVTGSDAKSAVAT
jgi:UDP-N-acetylmuramate-alanine ligase